MGWSWYLANDMQFFAFLPVVLIVYGVNRVSGYALLFAIVLQNIITTAVLSHKYDMDITTMNPDYSMHVYGRPWTRSAVYYEGVALALYYHEKKLRNNLLVKQGQAPEHEHLSGKRFALYVICSIMCVWWVYVLPWGNLSKNGILAGGTWSQEWKDLFNALNRPMFGVFLGGMLHMFFSGFGWLARDLLEHRIFDSLSQLTYGAYLWHLFVMSVYNGSARQADAFSETDIMWWYLAVLVLSFTLSFLSFLILERPFLNLESWMMSSLFAKKSNNKNMNNMSSLQKPLVEAPTNDVTPQQAQP
jgi:peptidoglycan/LPS O-acetylase OafA/YrhL